MVRRVISAAPAANLESTRSIPRRSVQVYEGLWYIALCLALLLTRQWWAPAHGILAGLFFVGMFLSRFFLEFTKEGTVVFAGMNTRQVLSVPLVIVGALVLTQSRLRRKQRAR
jgi:prolipoprotein diacylglyceryltransferase